jgi:hypothetical protein
MRVKEAIMVSPPLTCTKGDIDEFMRHATITLDLTARP